MRLISAILSVLMLYLSVMPCDDLLAADNCGSEIHFHSENEHDGHSDTDGCSPFCVCQCCQTNVVMATAVSGIGLVASVVKLFTETSRFNSISTSDFWRPPQA